MKVIQVFRKRKQDFFSIEKVYQAVNQHLGSSLELEEVELGVSAARWKAILSNWKQLRKMKADVYHITGEVNYVSLFLPGNKTILTLHDCNFIRRSNGVKAYLLKLFWLTLPVKHCRKIIAISQATKEDIIRLTGCDAQKIEVIPNPVLEYFEPRPKPTANNPFKILQVGTRWNKNLERVLDALDGLPVQLTILGKVTNEQEEIISSRKLDLIYVSNLNEPQLVNLYQQSNLVMFASLSEGFGLPILEAQATGTPVITSNLEPMCTVAGQGALLVDPYDVSDIRKAVLLISGDPSFADSLIEKGFENVEAYRSEAIAKKYEGIYKRVAEAS